jgi:hypothetical protein
VENEKTACPAHIRTNLLPSAKWDLIALIDLAIDLVFFPQQEDIWLEEPRETAGLDDNSAVPLSLETAADPFAVTTMTAFDNEDMHKFNDIALRTIKNTSTDIFHSTSMKIHSTTSCTINNPPMGFPDSPTLGVLNEITTDSVNEITVNWSINDEPIGSSDYSSNRSALRQQ